MRLELFSSWIHKSRNDSAVATLGEGAQWGADPNTLTGGYCVALRERSKASMEQILRSSFSQEEAE
jgi:hypothetical protein